MSFIRQYLPELPEKLIEDLLNNGEIKEVPANTTLFKEGSYVRVVPIVLKGLLKVYTQQSEKELLLYYIQPAESCIMSFMAALRREKSRIFAVSEEPSLLLLIPSDRMNHLLSMHPGLNNLFYQQFDLRYGELISTINHLLYDRLDKRIMDYLLGKTRINKQSKLVVSHREIAKDLGTAREVVTRLMKKLEGEGKLKQYPDGIMILKDPESAF
jgi:CRP/FNR family transcriptional regulator